MPLIDRVTRLFRADLHAVIDRIEEPEALLRQALREMEEELAAGSARLRTATLEREQLQRRTQETVQSLAGIGQELDLCFAAGNETLVRTLLRRRLEGERRVAALRSRGAACERLLAQEGERQAERQRALEELRQRAALCPAADGEARHGASGEEDLVVTEADIDLALLRERDARRTA
jgi:phage shock protein A